jgi:uncharacterized RDD family membrane protein YckC
MNTRNLKPIWNGMLGVLGGLALYWATPALAQTTNAEETTATQSTNTPSAEADATGTAATNASPAEVTGGMIKLGRHRSHGNGEPLVVFGQNVEVPEGETRQAVVVIGGSAKVRGQVTDAVVVIGGRAEISGEVGNAVVCVLGNVQLTPGARIHGAAVAVCGNLEVQDGADVDGDAVSVLGKLDVAKPNDVKGRVVHVLAGPFPSFEPFRKYFVQCVLKLRPLAPSVGWVWPVAGVFLLLYVLVAVAFPRPVQHCVDELTRRPATTFLIGLLTKMLIPIVTLILVATGIGIFIVPFLGAAVLFAGIVGKVALLQYFGQQLGKQFSRGTALQPLAALLIGAALLTVLYIVPVLGLLALLTTGLWALGAAAMALFGGMRRENPERTQPPASPPPAAPAAIGAVNLSGVAPAVGPASPPMSTPAGSAQPSGATMAAEVTAPPVEASPASPPTPEAWSLPRAGFWERMGAAFLDLILVGIVSGLVGRGALGLLVTLAYFAGMWAWKGTTVGGVVLKLKVVRLDGQPITFPVALVRGLAGAFSLVVMFLGFFWIAWDKEKQGWHDKIAGTVVVRLPHTQSLVCF